MKLNIKKIGVGLGIAGAIVFGAPVVKEEMKWVVSYRTMAFETEDADLGMDEYAIEENGVGFYVRRVPKSEGGYVWTTDVGDTVDKKPVLIRCFSCAWYSIFFSKDGSFVRETYNKTDYDGLRIVEKYPQPTKIERETLLGWLKGDDAYAAVGFDATTNSGNPGGADSYTWAHTSTGSNLVLAVGITGTDAGVVADCQGAAGQITYNSVALTLQQTNTHSTFSSGLGSSQVWYLVAPAGGSNTVSVVLNGNCSISSGGSITFTGVNQSVPIDTSTGVNNGAVDPEVVNITVVAESGIIAAAQSDTSNPANIDPAANTTQAWEIDQGVDVGWGGYRIITTLGSYTVGFDTSSGGVDHALSAVSFAPAAAAPAAGGDQADDFIIIQ